MLETHHDVYFHEKTQLGIITLNRPTALNALTHPMVTAIQTQLSVWANKPAIKAVAITSTSNKAFCAGGDIRQVYHARNQPDFPAQRFFADEYRLIQTLYHYPKPYIALLDGITMGGGAGIAINGSHRVATENFLFAMPETTIGFFPDVGASFFLSRCPHQLGVYLGLTSARIAASDAIALKLLTHTITAQQLPSLIEAVSSADFTTDTAENVVNNILASFQSSLETPTLHPHYSQLEHCFAQSTIENILHALESHHLSWYTEIAATLKTKSPTSLKITLQAIDRKSVV